MRCTEAEKEVAPLIHLAGLDGAKGEKVREVEKMRARETQTLKRQHKRAGSDYGKIGTSGRSIELLMPLEEATMDRRGRPGIEDGMAISQQAHGWEWSWQQTFQWHERHESRACLITSKYLNDVTGTELYEAAVCTHEVESVV